MKRLAVSVVVGAMTFALAFVVLILMLEIIFGSYQFLDVRHAAVPVRRVLSFVAFFGIVGPALGVLFGLPFFAARRWRTNAAIGVVVACVLAGFIGDSVVYGISTINQSEAGHSFPYDVPPDE